MAIRDKKLVRDLKSSCAQSAHLKSGSKMEYDKSSFTSHDYSPPPDSHFPAPRMIDLSSIRFLRFRMQGAKVSE